MNAGLRVGLTVGGGDGAAAFPPVASFTTSAAGVTVTFTDTSGVLVNQIVAWEWAFGDGSYSTTQNPSHAYTAEGTYQVTLTVRDSLGLTSYATSTINVVLWDIDATSGKPVPATAGQWANFTSANSLVVGAPEHLWLFQDAAGPIVAAFGGKPLTVTGSPSFQQSETGWSRKFIRASGAAANQIATASGMTAATTPVAVLTLARIAAPVGIHQRVFYGGASSNAWESTAGAAMRYRTGASARSGAASHVGSVRWFWMVHDPSGTGRMGIYSALEKLTFNSGTSPAYAARSGTGIQFQFGTTDTTALTSVGLGAAWSGAGVTFADVTAMDAAARALLTALGEPPVW